MRKQIATFLALAAGTLLASAQTSGTVTNAPWAPLPSPASVAPKPVKPAKTPHVPPTAQTLAQMQSSLDELTKSNRDLLDLLKQQQAVLEDIQYDRRIQNRQIETLETRLEEALTQKQQLQEKIDRLELQGERQPAMAQGNSATPPTPAPAPGSGSGASVATANNPPAAPTIETVKNADTDTPPAGATPPPPATYLPPESAGNQSGQGGSWHRLFTLKGTDNLQSEVFTIHAKMWRVLWHNQDKGGKLYANTSALFINAYPRDDTIPERVCTKLGSGGDSTDLKGPGNFYLKIEASGGSWELAVEEIR